MDLNDDADDVGVGVDVDLNEDADDVGVGVDVDLDDELLLLLLMMMIMMGHDLTRSLVVTFLQINYEALTELVTLVVAKLAAEGPNALLEAEQRAALKKMGPEGQQLKAGALLVFLPGGDGRG